MLRNLNTTDNPAYLILKSKVTVFIAGVLGNYVFHRAWLKGDGVAYNRLQYLLPLMKNIRQFMKDELGKAVEQNIPNAKSAFNPLISKRNEMAKEIRQLLDLFPELKKEKEMAA